MTENGKRPCDEELVGLLYNVLLGRDPESKDMWLGTPISEAARDVLASDEFKAIATSCLEMRFAGPPNEKSRAARSVMAEMLVRYGAPPPRTNMWHDLLLSGLMWFRTMPLDESAADLIDPVIEVIKAEFRGAIGVDDVLDDALRFDPKWFLAANKGAVDLGRLSDVDLEYYAAHATLNGDAELSPYFSVSGEEKRELRRAIFDGLGSNDADLIAYVLGRMRTAAKKGMFGHWLFDEQYYIRERDMLFDKPYFSSWEPSKNPYLDFIINGDKNGVRPHPLFCPFSYQLMNPDFICKSRAFDHYLRVGQFLELKTSALFDPEFYEALNPSVRLALSSGRFASALESVCKEGARKGYAFSPDFDPCYYLANYNDAAEASQNGAVSAGWHFLTIGAREGRCASPYFDPGYYRQRYPAVGAICNELSISPIEHYILLGRADGLRPSKPLLDRAVDPFQAKAIYERRALDSLIRVSRKPLDFSDFAGPDPMLSIIVPVHDQVSFTARFLELAYYACAEMKRRAGGSSEIIVVSNGSTDKTGELLETFGGIKFCVTAEALGYPRAANRGAHLATGRYLLFVNNDTEFDPAIFADLVASFAETPNCGALGPRILSMDMTIQEIGSFVAGDGSTGGYERGSRSSHQSGLHKQAVDYVSGCFLCLERADFEILEGFDEAFSPGYYEEVDLCLRISETLGKEVWVDPGLSVLHYEHASFMKGRPITVSYPLILRNRKTIMRKHPFISAKMPPDKFRGAGGTGSRGERRTKVLVIMDLIADLLRGAGFGRTAGVLRVFHDLGISYDVLALDPSMKMDEYEFPDVALYRSWMPSESVEELLGGDVSTYSYILVCGMDNLNKLSGLLKVYKIRHSATVICDAELFNVHRTIEMARVKGDACSDVEVMGLVTSEISTDVADQIVAMSEQDAAMMRSAGINNVSVIGHSVSGPATSSYGRDNGSRILIVGDVTSALSATFNNISWFAQFVMPKIAQLGKNLTFVGYWQDELLGRFIKSHPSENIEFTGKVSEDVLSELYHDSVLAVAPTRVASDHPWTVIAAMLGGTPIVMSRPLGDQIGVPNQDFGALAVASVDDDGEDFARVITRLSSDGEWWNTVRDTQMAFAASNFSRETLTQQVVNLFQEIGVTGIVHQI